MNLTTFSRPRRHPLALLVAAVCLVPQAADAQGTMADYKRASELPGLTRDKVAGDRVQPYWFSEDGRFWYRMNKADRGWDYRVLDPGTGRVTPAFDAVKLAEALTKATGKPHEADRLDVPVIASKCTPESIAFRGDGKRWTLKIDNGALTEIGTDPEADEDRGSEDRRNRFRRRGGERRDASPDGRWTVELKNHNLFLHEKGRPEAAQITSDGTSDNSYEPRVVWSPDSTRLVALRTKKGGDRKVTLVESSPKDQLQPKTSTYDYLKPGDDIPLTKPYLYDVLLHEGTLIKDDLFPNPWSLDRVQWQPDSRHFTFLYNQRGHQVLRVVDVDAATGEPSTVVEETPETFVDYSQKTFAHIIPDHSKMIWMSERDGWNHLYLVDVNNHAILNQITKGPWVVHNVERVDDETGQIWFTAGGVVPEQDPYYIHHCRINFDGGGFLDLTPGDGTHDITYSPDGASYLDRYSRVDLPTVSELRKTEDGSLVSELARGDWSALLEAGWKVPERFVAKGRDGATDIYGVIYRPTNHDPSRKYPVIEAIYAGPHGAHVPKRFSAFHWTQSLAELGFIVVQIDGMGTNWRSKAFHDVCWKNLADAGFPDRILWMKAAAEKDPSMDLSRVGIFGGSAGGQNALGALLFHPEFYKVAAADCGCHDNRMDKIWWNEAWMGWPIGPHYAEQSNVTNAHKLQGKLLLTVGELDHNVDPSSTMQVVNALIRADKDFELIVFPGADHGAGGGPYGDRRRRDFFVRNLLGVEPRSQ